MTPRRVLEESLQPERAGRLGDHTGGEGIGEALLRISEAAREGLDVFCSALAENVVRWCGLSRAVVLVRTQTGSGPSLAPICCNGYNASQFPKGGFRLDEGQLNWLLSGPSPRWIRGPDEAVGLRRMLGTSTLLLVRLGSRGVFIGDTGKSSARTEDVPLGQLELLAGIAGSFLERITSCDSGDACSAHQLLRALPIAVIATKPQGSVVVYTSLAEALLKVPEAEAIGRPLDRIVNLSLDARSAETLSEAIESARQCEVPMHLWMQRLVLRTGHSFVANVTVCRWKADQGMIVTIEDVTERAVLEEDMEQVRHLAQLGQMTAQIAHELRNPLTSIRGAAQLLQQIEPGGSGAEFAKIILQEVDNLSRIADDFLDFARPLQLRTRPTVLRDLVEDFVTVWRPVCGDQGIDIRSNVPRNLPILWIDALRMNQVLRNLALNACQAMPSGGRLSISACMNDPGDEVVIRVRDTGIGMSEEEAVRAFEPFFTTKTKGSGLGLAVVRKLVEAHGGRIEVSSKPAKGTTFTIRLPISAPEGQTT